MPQLIRAFNEARRNNRIYVKLTRATSGAIVAGEREPALPPSVLAVIEGAQPGVVVQPLSSAVVGEWDVAVRRGHHRPAHAAGHRPPLA